MLAEQDESGLFYVQHRNQPEEATVAVTRIFLGTQLQCARCHDHPYEAWTQRDFYGMAGFFVRLVVVEGEAVKGKRKVTIGEKSTGEVLFTGSAKEQRPGQKHAQEPMNLLFGSGFGPQLATNPVFLGRRLQTRGFIPRAQRGGGVTR